MKDVFDDDDNDDSDGEPIPAKRSTDPSGTAARKVREENEAKLRAMMNETAPAKSASQDAEDEQMEDAAEEIGSPDWPADQDEDDDDDDDETADAALDKPAPKEPSPPARPSGDGRRRGRRRVTKKKTFQDEKGYFVTKEVEEWEEFSESEEDKPTPKAAPKFESKKKSTPAVAAKGKGNITSFFGKKQ
jgi:DNA polymerase delta subunit 3